ncbi:MAG: hypothetical protein JSS27_03680 [Planctomycetes bacterium]|nr:hypothetical protein [Planctomycetota bacterium]
MSNEGNFPMANVPVFGCTVYVAQIAEGRVRARVANLDGIECTAANERMALGTVVTEFKNRVREHTARQEPIPWLDPPAPRLPDEQQRFVPVHL